MTLKQVKKMKSIKQSQQDQTSLNPASLQFAPFSSSNRFGSKSRFGSSNNSNRHESYDDHDQSMVKRPKVQNSMSEDRSEDQQDSERES